MIILQISPEFTPGTGVGGVAFSLEQEWLALGHDVRRFGPVEARCTFLATPGQGLRGRLRHAAFVVWFSTVGTVLARRALRELPGASVSICHNDALAGDVYVNHGVLTSAMRARGRFVWLMIRNPLHLLTAARDHCRYRFGTHDAVVSLSEADRKTLVESYGLDADKAVVIPNGVHLDRFRPPTAAERTSARQSVGVPPDVRLVAFVGHEFDRKGLPLLLRAVSELPDHHVVVVGGSPEQIQAQRAHLDEKLSQRVHWLGRVLDPVRAFAAADVLALPSAYEANPLVVLEALASGLQVVATPVGSVPDMLSDDALARVVGRTAEQVRTGLAELAALNIETAAVQEQARARALGLDWSSVASAYLDLFAQLRTHGAGVR